MKSFGTSSMIVLGAILIPMNFAKAQTRWELERVIAPKEATQSESSHWTLAASLGQSPSGLGQTLLFSGQNRVPNGPADTHIVSEGPGKPELSFRLPYPSDFRIGSIWWDPGFALLKTPTGFQAAAKKYPWFLTFLDFPSGILIEEVKPPLPGPGETQQMEWTAIWNAGDINLDGFDDLFFQAHTLGVDDAYSGLVDGATHTLIWRTYSIGSESVCPLSPDPESGFPDLNSDGIPDFVSGFIHGLPPFSFFSRQVIAYSGLDGSIIWERILPYVGFDPGISGRDINGDGVADVITQASNQKLYALDGTNGSTLWISDVSAAFPLIPGGGTFLHFANPIFYEDSLQQNSSNTVSAIIGIRPPGFIDDLQFILTLSAVDGSPIAVSGFPNNLEPWLPDPTGPAPHATSFLVGDVDNDGLTEIARSFITPSRDPNGWFPHGVSSIAIFGPPTISLPATLHITQVHTAEFEIPSAPSMDIQLILSNEFKPRNGFEVDHWETNLAQGSMLRWSRGRDLRTTLDQDGKGSIDFTLPNKPGLVGSEVYLRGIVWDASAGPDKVWTISSLGKATIGP